MAIKQIEGYTIYLTQILGRGSYGNVYKGFCEKTSQPVAVKIINRESIDYDNYLKMSLRNQIKIMKTVQSQNIVGFLDVMESSKNYYIIQELCDGDLSYLIKPGQELPENYCIDILTQLCQGFLALVKEGVIHRDIKPANIFKRRQKFKIGDFGFSKQFDSQQKEKQEVKEKTGDIKMKTAVGTPLYMSVQILKSMHYTSKCDIWALGLIFYELLHGETPWVASRQFELVQKIESIPLKIKRKDLSKNTMDFITKCLQIQQKDRISWNQIFVHPIFNGRFQNRADENKQFENKMKSIMTKLRYYFHLNRQKLEAYLNKYGYKDAEDQLSFQNYYQFLKVANPNITHSEAVYIFKKTDIDGNGSISLEQILLMLKNYGIAVEDPRLTKVYASDSQGPSFLTEELRMQVQAKVIKFFKRLHKMIDKNNLSLRRVFNDFDKAKKGYLIFQQFKDMTQKLLKEITDDDALVAFGLIDDDFSETISFKEICKYYCQINNLPEAK